MEIIRKDENGQVIAKIIFFQADDEYETMIHAIDVDPDHRRKGIAWDLLTGACDKLRELGEEKVMMVAAYDAAIGIDNLVKFYEDFGFSVIPWGGSNIFMEMYFEK